MTFPLTIRTTIPLLLLLFAALMAGGGLLLLQAMGARDAELKGHEEFRYLMDVVQGSVNTLLRRNDNDAIKSLLTSLATSDQIRTAILVDAKGTILVAIRRERIGKHIGLVLPHVRRNLLKDVMGSKAGVIELGEDRQTLLAVYPAYLQQESHRLRPVNVGLVVIEKSLEKTKARVNRTIEQHVAMFTLFAIGLAGLLWLTLHLLITRRLSKVTQTTTRLAAGDFTARTDLRGSDELAILGMAVNHMATRLAAKHQRIAASELRQRLSQEAANIGTWEWNIQTGELICSQITKTFFGRAPQTGSIDFDDYIRSVHRDDRESVLQAINATLQGKQQYNIQHRIVLPGGEVRWLHVLGDLIREESTKSLRLLGAAHDITEQKQRDLQVQHMLAELNFQKYALDQHAIVAITDAKGLITYVNDRFCDISQYNSTELIGQNHRLINSGYHPREFFHELWRTIRSGKTWQGDICNRKRNGDLYWVNTTIVPHLNTQGVPDSYTAIRTEITKQKQTEAALKQSMSQFRAIFEEAAIGMAVVEMESGIKIVNNALKKMLGYDMSEFAHKLPNDFSHADDLNKDSDLYHELLAGQRQSYSVEKRFLNKDEGILWAAMTVSLVRSTQGDPLFAIYMMEDISDRQQLQLQLQQSKKMETIGLLAGGIAHDFNNMLLSIMGYTELAKEKFATDGNGKLAGYLEQVLKASERARDLIAQLLAFSRNSELAFKPLQLKPLIKESLKMLRSALPSSIALKIDIEPNLPEVIADPTKLFQMMMNLCINARDAMNGSGHISLALHTVHVDQQICQSCHQSYCGHYIELAVRDNGHGIAPDILDKIFDPFFTTKEVGKGTGMGLSTVHGLVHEHGGHIQIESDAKAGTVVKLILPVSVDNDALHTTSLPGEVSNPATILVVDGDESIAQLIADVLRQNDYIVDIAADSHAALKRFERYPDQYDMVITEHILPGFSGRRLAQKILQQKPYLPIIFCSGMNEHIKKNEIFQLGIQGFLQKPFNIQDLLDLVDELLSRKPARAFIRQVAKRA